MQQQLKTLGLIIALLLMNTVLIQAQDDIDCADDSHLIDHALGTSCVPAEVERVVTLEWSYTEAVLALGVQPVGMADIEGYHGWVDIPVEIDESVVDVGTRQEPNLEQIIELDPDLIIAPAFRVVESYDQLNAIAPTLAFDAYPTDTTHYDGMINTFNTIATLLDREAEAEAVLADLQATYDATAQAIAESDIALDNFILAQSYISGDAPVFRLFTDNAMAAEILRQLGLENAWTDAPQQYGFTTVDFEGFSEIEDTLFFYIAQDEANEQIVNASVWSALPFVQNDHQYWLGGDVWLFGGPLSAMTLVETISDSLGLDVEDTDTSDDTASTCDEGFRLIEHAEGADCIPNELERIVVLDEGTMTDLLALGIQPIAVMDWGNRDYAQYLDLDPSTIESVGTPEGPNFEAILELEPDVILGYADNIQWFGDNALENLQAIAPTVLSPAVNPDWQSHLLFLGEVVGAEDRAQSLLDSFNTRLGEFATAWEASGDDSTIAIIRSRADSFNIYANDYFISDTVKAAGLQMPDSFAELPERIAISVEEIDMLDSDYLFVMARNTDEAEAFMDASEGPLWQFLPAVENDKVYQVNWSVWVAGWNVVGAHLVVDDLFHYLLDTEPPTPNPLSDVISDDFSPTFDVERFADTTEQS